MDFQVTEAMLKTFQLINGTQNKKAKIIEERWLQGNNTLQTLTDRGLNKTSLRRNVSGTTEHKGATTNYRSHSSIENNVINCKIFFSLSYNF